MVRKLCNAVIFILFIVGIFAWMNKEAEKNRRDVELSAQEQQTIILEDESIARAPITTPIETPLQTTTVEIPSKEIHTEDIYLIEEPQPQETARPETIEPFEDNQVESYPQAEPSQIEDYSEDAFQDALPTNASEAPDSSDDSTVSPVDISGADEFVILDLINAERRSLGLNELEYDPVLSELSGKRCAEMFDYGYFSHKRPNGDGWWTILEDEDGLIYEHATENIAQTIYNTFYEKDKNPVLDGAYWFNQWKNSESHYEAMISDKSTHVGISTFYGTRDGDIIRLAASIFASYR